MPARVAKRDLPFAPVDWPATKVKSRKLSDIKPWPDNPKKHPPEQIKLLASLMLKHGVDQPIVMDENGFILKGHGRRLAAIEAGFEEFPVVQHFGLSDEEKRAMRIADNQVSLLGGWDEKLLKADIGALSLAGYDMKLLGFKDRELVKWGSEASAGSEEALPPVVRKAFVRPGDVWKLGNHVLACGSATDAKIVDRVLKGRKDKATIFTDPPYGVDFKYNEHEDTPEANADLVQKAFELGPDRIVWTPGSINMAREFAKYPDAKMLHWHKHFGITQNGLGGADTMEPVFVVNIKGGALPDNYLPFAAKHEKSPIDGNVWLNEEHPCPKPVALFAHLIACLSPQDGIVYEPFSGSGTTLIASQQAGRTFAGVEIDPRYVELAIRRWMAFTGKVATLDGQTFAKVEAERKKTRPKSTGSSKAGSRKRQAAVAK